MFDFAARRPWLALAIAATVFGTAGLGVTQLEPRVDFVDTVPASPSVDAYRELLAKLDGTKFVAIYMPSAASTNLRDDASFDRLVQEQRSLTERINQSFPGAFSHSLSVYEAMRAGNYMFQKVLTAGNPPASAYAVPTDPVSYRYVRDEVRGEAGKDVLAANGQSAIALFFFAQQDDAQARELAGAVESEVGRWHAARGPSVTAAPQVSGLAYAAHITDVRTQQDIRIWGAIAAAATFASLLLIVRRPLDIAVAGTSLFAGTTAAFGLVGWLQLPVSFLTVFLVPVVTGIGMDYALHIFHASHAKRVAGFSPRLALQHALRSTGPAVAASAAATILGLLVLLFVEAPLFAQVGLLGALGVAMGLLASLTLAPALRAVLPPNRGTPRPDRIGQWVARRGMAARRRPLVTLSLVGLLALGGGLLASQANTASGSADNEFPQDDPTIVLQHRIEAEYGAFQRAYLVVQGDIAQPGILQHLLEASKKAQALPLYRQASSISTLLAADAATDQGLADIPLGTARPTTDSERLPTTAAEAKAALDRLFADPLWRGIAPFVISRDYTLAVVAIQVNPWQDNRELEGLSNALNQLAESLANQAGPQYQVHAAGAPLNRNAVEQAIPRDIALSTLGVGAVVAVSLVVPWFRRGRSGIAAAAVGVAIVMLAALLLLASVPALDLFYKLAAAGGAPANSASLSQMFLLAFAVTVAVGVDGHIQVVHRAWLERDAGATADEAAERALRGVGRPITLTAITTVAAFAPLAGLYFLQSKNLAILAALGGAYAYLFTLLLTPLVAGRARRVNSSKDPEIGRRSKS
jgi:predicted RND superfamily exporter protein